MDFLDYDFVKIEQWEFLAKNVRKREDINCGEAAHENEPRLCA